MIRAYVNPDFARLGLAIHLIDQRGQDGPTFLAAPAELVFSEIDPMTSGQEPTLQLSDEAARALLDALAAHYGGSSDVQTLRKDYLAERARVDKMIDHMVRRAS